MAISNTSILIKRSLTTGRPTNLQAGEFAYSYASNTLFMGTPTGNGVVNVGGQFYTATLDAATQSNTASTLVKRNEHGAVAGRFYGLANSAITLDVTRNFSITGSDITASAQTFNGSSDVVLNAYLNTVPGLSAGYYGGSTPSSSTIPVLQVAANGRIMAIANTTVTSSFDISNGTTTTQVQSGNTFYHIGTQGIVTNISQNTVTFSTDSTVLRSNTPGLGRQLIYTDVAITGNLIVTGNTQTIEVQSLNIADPLIYLAGENYSSDIVDIGFAANYYDGASERHTGLVRKASTPDYYLFYNYLEELSANNHIDPSDASFKYATLHANLTSSNITSSQISTSTFVNGNIVGLTSDLDVSDGGTGVSSFNAGQVIIGGGGSQPLKQLANVASINTTIAANSTVNNLTTDVWGRVTNYSTQAISGLTVGQGGTGRSSFFSGQILVGAGTDGLQTIANTGTAGSYGSASYVPVITTDVWGRVSNVSNTAIELDTSRIISGTLGVPRGGTGFSTATNKGIVYGNGTGALQVTAAADTADQTWSNQIMTVNNSGIPVWSTAMDGGQF